MLMLSAKGPSVSDQIKQTSDEIDDDHNGMPDSASSKGEIAERNAELRRETELLVERWIKDGKPIRKKCVAYELSEMSARSFGGMKAATIERIIRLPKGKR